MGQRQRRKSYYRWEEAYGEQADGAEIAANVPDTLVIRCVNTPGDWSVGSFSFSQFLTVQACCMVESIEARRPFNTSPLRIAVIATNWREKR